MTFISLPPIANSRLELMQEGAKTLHLWLEHILERKFLVLERDPDIIANMAKQMVDYKLGSIAKRLRVIEEQINDDQDWLDDAKDELARMHRMCLGFAHWNNISDAWKWDIAQYAGVNVKKEKVLEHVSIKALWLIVGREEEKSESITTYKTWLYNNDYGFATIIDFAFGRKRPTLLPLGNHYLGEICFYPSAFPLRCLTKSMRYARDKWQPKQGINDFKSLREIIIQNWKVQPWLESLPFHISPAGIICEGASYFCVDKEGRKLSISSNKKQLDYLIGAVLDSELHLWGVWNGEHFVILSVFAYGAFLGVL